MEERAQSGLVVTVDKGIVIKNVFYMLSYAFEVLKQNTYEKINGEKFEDMADLLAEVLAIGIGNQLKRGFYKTYVGTEDALVVPKGKIMMSKTASIKARGGNKIDCSFDVFTEDNDLNRIMKSSCLYLISRDDVQAKRKNELRSLIRYLSGVSSCDLANVSWNRLVYERNNESYRMLMNVCYFVANDLLLTTESGKNKMPTFLKDEHMNMLFERFVRNYYKKYFSEDLSISKSDIPWDLTSGDSDYLPKMETDVTIQSKKRPITLIVDTKYYGSVMSTHYDKEKYHSANLYQMFAYVKNKDTLRDGKQTVSGLLLYARTGEKTIPEKTYEIGGNKIAVKFVDLNKDFKEIQNKLDSIIFDYFAIANRTSLS